jgi:hypothetical protein
VAPQPRQSRCHRQVEERLKKVEGSLKKVEKNLRTGDLQSSFEVAGSP